MVRLSGKLTNLHLRTVGPGTHSDGGGLYLQVRQGAAGLAKSWVYRYVVGSKQTWLGLGSYPTISLATAREKAADARRLRNEGGDPLAQKRAVRASLSQEKARPLTFAECASAYIKSHFSGGNVFNRSSAAVLIVGLPTPSRLNTASAPLAVTAI